MAGAVVGTIAVDAFRHVRRPAERWIALVPVVLAGHQLVEAAVWASAQGELPAAVGRFAAWVYLMVAFGVVPVLVPLAVRSLEPAPVRKHLRIFLAIDIAVAAALSWAVARGPVDARVQGHHIAYTVDLWHGSLLVAFYVLATTGALLLSSLRYVRRFGLVNLVAAAFLAWLNADGFISLWCLWASVMSVGIAIHLRTERSPAPRVHGLANER